MLASSFDGANEAGLRDHAAAPSKSMVTRFVSYMDGYSTVLIYLGSTSSGGMETWSESEMGTPK